MNLLVYQESEGAEETLHRGHIQYFSAGTGVLHSAAMFIRRDLWLGKRRSLSLSSLLFKNF